MIINNRMIMAALWSNHIDTTTIQIFKTIPKKQRNLQTQKKPNQNQNVVHVVCMCLYFQKLFELI